MNRVILAVSAGLVLATLAAAQTDAPPDPAHDHEWTIEGIPSGQVLEVRLLTGAELHITTWDRDQVSVVSDWTEGRCPDARISLTRSGEGALLESRYPAGHGVQVHNCSFRVEVHIPRRFDVRLRSAGGSVAIAGLQGTVAGRTGGGSLTLERMRGEVRLTTGGGSIRVSESDLAGSVSTGGGHIDFVNVTGPLVGRSGSMRGAVRARTRERST